MKNPEYNMNEMCRTVFIYASYFKGSIMNTGRKLENVLAICFILYTFLYTILCTYLYTVLYTLL